MEEENPQIPVFASLAITHPFTAGKGEKCEKCEK
jgi:hypothetical protein